MNFEFYSCLLNRKTLFFSEIEGFYFANDLTCRGLLSFLDTVKRQELMKKQMTFEEVLGSEFRYLVEAIEWGSSDPQVEQMLRRELFEKTGYTWID